MSFVEFFTLMEYVISRVVLLQKVRHIWCFLIEMALPIKITPGTKISGRCFKTEYHIYISNKQKRHSTDRCLEFLRENMPILNFTIWRKQQSKIFKNMLAVFIYIYIYIKIKLFYWIGIVPPLQNNRWYRENGSLYQL